MKRLEPHYDIVYTNEKGMCAHEFIIDIRPFNEAGVQVIDVAKRMQVCVKSNEKDYGFHPPTMSFPVSGTLMIEPTESESKKELDRFVDALVSIRQEIRDIETGKVSKTDNVLVNAPHPIDVLVSNEWNHAYTREQAAYPLASLRTRKYWPSVSRVDDTFGDRNLMCSCPAIESYEE
jgi:glycine dehydrogenase